MVEVYSVPEVDLIEVSRHWKERVVVVLLQDDDSEREVLRDLEGCGRGYGSELQGLVDGVEVLVSLT